MPNFLEMQLANSESENASLPELKKNYTFSLPTATKDLIDLINYKTKIPRSDIVNQAIQLYAKENGFIE